MRRGRWPKVIDESAWWGRHRCRSVVYARSTSSCHKDLLDTSHGGIQPGENGHASVAVSSCCVVLSRKLQALSGDGRFRPPSPHRHTRKKVHPGPSKANNIPPTNHISTHDNDKIPPLHRSPRRQCKADRRRHVDNNRL